jgi:hypothetical protein
MAILFYFVDDTAGECSHHNTNATDNFVALGFQSLAKLQVICQDDVRPQPLRQGSRTQISLVQSKSLQLAALRRYFAWRDPLNLDKFAKKLEHYVANIVSSQFGSHLRGYDNRTHGVQILHTTDLR